MIADTRLSCVFIVLCLVVGGGIWTCWESSVGAAPPLNGSTREDVSSGIGVGQVVSELVVGEGCDHVWSSPMEHAFLQWVPAIQRAYGGAVDGKLFEFQVDCAVADFARLRKIHYNFVVIAATRLAAQRDEMVHAFNISVVVPLSDDVCSVGCQNQHILRQFQHNIEQVVPKSLNGE